MEFFHSEKYVPLDTVRAENFVIANNDIREVHLDLKNESNQMQNVEVRFYVRDMIDDFGNSRLIKSAILQVPSGLQKICFSLDSNLDPNCTYGIELYPAKSLFWGYTIKEAVGTQAAAMIDQLFYCAWNSKVYAQDSRYILFQF